MSASAAHGHAEHHTNYVKIWAILLALLIVSVLGPMLEVRVITLITAFGIAIVKAAMVVRYFMHLNVERKFVGYLLTVMIVLMVPSIGILLLTSQSSTPTTMRTIMVSISMHDLASLIGRGQNTATGVEMRLKLAQMWMSNYTYSAIK